MVEGRLVHGKWLPRLMKAHQKSLSVQIARMTPMSARVNSEALVPGDVVVGSERAEIIVAPPGLTVESVTKDNATGAIWIKWVGHERPEGFNPLWTWYVDANRKENNNG
jgi:hypothetical protein